MNNNAKSVKCENDYKEIEILRRKLKEGYSVVKRDLCQILPNLRPTYYLIFHNFERNDTKSVVISREEFRDLTMSKEYSIKELLENEDRKILLSTLDSAKGIMPYEIPHDIQAMLYGDWQKCTQFTKPKPMAITCIPKIEFNFDKPQIKVDEKKRTVVLYTQERVIVKKCQEGDKFDERIGIGLALSEWYGNENAVWKKWRNEIRNLKTHKLKYREYALKVYDEYFGIRREK